MTLISWWFCESWKEWDGTGHVHGAETWKFWNKRGNKIWIVESLKGKGFNNHLWSRRFTFHVYHLQLVGGFSEILQVQRCLQNVFYEKKLPSKMKRKHHNRGLIYQRLSWSSWKLWSARFTTRTWLIFKEGEFSGLACISTINSSSSCSKGSSVIRT